METFTNYRFKNLKFYIIGVEIPGFWGIPQFDVLLHVTRFMQTVFDMQVVRRVIQEAMTNKQK
jgi:hypothetical protein